MPVYPAKNEIFRAQNNRISAFSKAQTHNIVCAYRSCARRTNFKGFEMAQKKHIRHHAIVAHFAERLRDTRRASGMSQQDLARRAKVSTTYIGKLERGESSVGIDMAALSAAYTGSPSSRPNCCAAATASVRRSDRRRAEPTHRCAR